MKKETSYDEIIRKCYIEILDREPDEAGFNYFLNQLEKKRITIEDLPIIFRNSDEYKILHPTNLLKSNLTREEWMKNDWNARAKIDAKFATRTVQGQTEKEFWSSGEKDRDYILGVNTSRYNLIFGNKNPKEMKVLEIGCGIGRILIPMAKIFGEAVGVDVSTEMVRISTEYTRSIHNCKILENDGSDLSMFDDNYFDFCYSFIVFQHIPEKIIIENYIKEVSRVLKSGSLFRFQIRGDVPTKSLNITTWNGVYFTSDEIHNISRKNRFEILEEHGEREEYYFLTFRSIK